MFTDLKTRFFLILLLCGLVSVAALGQQPRSRFPETASKLAASSKGRIKVAFVLTEDAVMIDFAGPWEVFQDVMVPSRGARMEDQHVFDLYTVSDGTGAIRTSGGMRVNPDYTFANAPAPNVVVVPAQSGNSTKMTEWLRKMAKQSDVMMSVCTGAFALGKAGLLDGKEATTHHGAYADFEHEFASVKIVRNMRYVQSDPVVFTAGGLSSGIDLALHIVELYFGRDVAAATARTMEYEGKGWLGDGSAAESWTGETKFHPSDRLANGALGNWRGILNASDGSFRIALHIWQAPGSGGLAGTVDDIDHDANDVPLTAITFQGSGLHFEAGGGFFDGDLSPDESAIKGVWTLGSSPTMLEFKRSVQ
jgi:putative intracellular protease/amidase